MPFVRLGLGSYLFGTRHVNVKVSNERPIFRVGGGFASFDKFMELYANEELERLLQYDVDTATGMTKMQQALKSHSELMQRSGQSVSSAAYRSTLGDTSFLRHGHPQNMQVAGTH